MYLCTRFRREFLARNFTEGVSLLRIRVKKKFTFFCLSKEKVIIFAARFRETEIKVLVFEKILGHHKSSLKY